MTMVASVNSATGTALAAAALDTTTPCSQVVGVTVIFTVPAAYARSRSLGIHANIALSRTLQPQLPMRISTLASMSESRALRSTACGATSCTSSSSQGAGSRQQELRLDVGDHHQRRHWTASSPRGPVEADSDCAVGSLVNETVRRLCIGGRDDIDEALTVEVVGAH